QFLQTRQRRLEQRRGGLSDAEMKRQAHAASREEPGERRNASLFRQRPRELHNRKALAVADDPLREAGLSDVLESGKGIGRRSRGLQRTVEEPGDFLGEILDLTVELFVPGKLFLSQAFDQHLP